MQRPKMDTIELWPEMTYGAQYILCVVYYTCRLSFTVIGLPCEEKQETIWRIMLKNTYPEGNQDQVSFISD